MSQSLVDYFEYRVKSGDSISLIMMQFFGAGPRSTKYNHYLKHVLTLNPHIKNPDRIRAGSMLRLGVIPPTNIVATSSAPNTVSALFSPRPNPNMCPVSNDPFVLNGVNLQDETDFWMLSWLAERSNFLTVPGSIALGAKGNLLGPGNIRYIEQISDFYADYKSGSITKGQYDYARRNSLNNLKNNLGPFDKWLFGNKTPHEAVRIARGGGVPATANIAKHAKRLNQLAALGKTGGFVLTGVGLAASCKQIADTDQRQEKNEIFVETIASTAVGLGTGFIIGLFLVSNPVGWGTALVLAGGSAAISYASGKSAGTAYTTWGTKVDLVSGLGVDSVCQ